jgi:hypothetical protein
MILLLAPAAPGQLRWKPAPTIVPLPRAEPALAYDSARQRTVLFGGLHGDPGLDDTWEWDGTVWTRRSPAQSPPARYGAALAFDSARGRAVLFGGRNATTPLADTWEWDGTTWHPRGSPLVPPSRSGHTLVYDSVRGRVVLFGGWRGGFEHPADTWEWDGTNWTPGPAPGPSGRWRHGAAYDPVRRRVVLYGGQQETFVGPITFTDTWEYDGTAWAERMPANRPVSETQHALFFDVALGRVLLYGGRSEVPGHFVTDTWSWDGTDWTPRTSVGVGARMLFALSYDSARRRAVLFGGALEAAPGLGPHEYYGDTWEWDGSAWALRAPDWAPHGRAYHAMAYDTLRNRLVLHGGVRYGGPGDDVVWEWDGSAWTRGPAGPSARGEHAMAYDALRRRTVLFGGFGFNGGRLADTWEWDGSTWVQRLPAVSPTARSGHAMVFDVIRGRTVLFGGESALGGFYHADTWEWDGTSWTLRAPAASPPARTNLGMAFDDARGRTVLHGGHGAARYTDTWEWDGTTWSNRLTPTHPPDPGYGEVQPLAFDPQRRRTVLVTPSAETWEWDGTSWFRRSTAPGPGPRYQSRLVWDAGRLSTLLFGGVGADAWLADAWHFDGRACEVIGPGHDGGGLAIACTSEPRLGGTLCVTFSDPPPIGLGVHGLVLGPGPALRPALVLDPPGVCARAYLHVAPVLALGASGNPAVFCIGVPNVPALAGAWFVLQGFSLEQGGCVRLTDALSATLE